MKARSEFDVPYYYAEGDRLICKMWATEEEREMVRSVANELGVRYQELFRLCYNVAVPHLLETVRREKLQVVNGSSDARRLTRAAKPKLRMVKGGGEVGDEA